MKAYLSVLLAVALCLSLLGCSGKSSAYTPRDYSKGEEPTEIVIIPKTTAPVSDKTLQLTDELSMTTNKASIVYAGVEYANKDLVDSESAVLFKFAFTNHQNAPTQSKSAFLIKYYQNGVEVLERSWYNSWGGDQYELCSNYSLEVAKGETNTYGRPVLLNDNSPVTVVIYEADHRENYQAMEIDLSGLPIVPVDTTLPTPAQIPNYTVNLESKKGSVRFVGFEKAHYGLMEDDHALVFQFEYTSRQPLPDTYHSAFLIKY